MPTLEVRVSFGDVTDIFNEGIGALIPLTFMVLQGNSDGTSTEYGFAPQVTGLIGAGYVDEGRVHNYDASSGQINISNEQYGQLMLYINDAKANPPEYNIPEGVQCASWVAAGLVQAGIIPPYAGPQGVPVYDSLIWNPYWQGIAFGLTNVLGRALELGSFASQLANGATITLQQISSSATSLTYADVTPDHLLDAANPPSAPPKSRVAR